ncbi:MAG: hypothetical protein HC925_03040 [Coleofasciculaceae cyanobacterium SM2_3_26]|nr:hypothetical protein [Coleofasciculaceae cyanobacterium SM2_3_26]
MFEPPEAICVTQLDAGTKASQRHSDLEASAPLSPPPPKARRDPEDWIETQYTPVGYVKHPLEQLLEWVDRIMVWLEHFWVRIWHWLTR